MRIIFALIGLIALTSAQTVVHGKNGWVGVEKEYTFMDHILPNECVPEPTESHKGPAHWFWTCDGRKAELKIFAKEGCKGEFETHKCTMWGCMADDGFFHGDFRAECWNMHDSGVKHVHVEFPLQITDKEIHHQACPPEKCVVIKAHADDVIFAWEKAEAVAKVLEMQAVHQNRKEYMAMPKHLRNRYPGDVEKTLFDMAKHQRAGTWHDGMLTNEEKEIYDAEKHRTDEEKKREDKSSKKEGSIFGEFEPHPDFVGQTKAEGSARRLLSAKKQDFKPQEVVNTADKEADWEKQYKSGKANKAEDMPEKMPKEIADVQKGGDYEIGSCTPAFIWKWAYNNYIAMAKMKINSVFSQFASKTKKVQMQDPDSGVKIRNDRPPERRIFAGLDGSGKGRRRNLQTGQMEEENGGVLDTIKGALVRGVQWVERTIAGPASMVIQVITTSMGKLLSIIFAPIVRILQLLFKVCWFKGKAPANYWGLGLEFSFSVQALFLGFGIGFGPVIDQKGIFEFYLAGSTNMKPDLKVMMAPSTWALASEVLSGAIGFQVMKWVPVADDVPGWGTGYTVAFNVPLGCSASLEFGFACDDWKSAIGVALIGGLGEVAGLLKTTALSWGALMVAQKGKFFPCQDPKDKKSCEAKNKPAAICKWENNKCMGISCHLATIGGKLSLKAQVAPSFLNILAFDQAGGYAMGFSGYYGWNAKDRDMFNNQVWIADVKEYQAAAAGDPNKAGTISRLAGGENCVEMPIAAKVACKSDNECKYDGHMKCVKGFCTCDTKDASMKGAANLRCFPDARCYICENSGSPKTGTLYGDMIEMAKKRTGGGKTQSAPAKTQQKKRVEHAVSAKQEQVEQALGLHDDEHKEWLSHFGDDEHQILLDHGWHVSNNPDKPHHMWQGTASMSQETRVALGFEKAESNEIYYIGAGAVALAATILGAYFYVRGRKDTTYAPLLEN